MSASRESRGRAACAALLAAALASPAVAEITFDAPTHVWQPDLGCSAWFDPTCWGPTIPSAAGHVAYMESTGDIVVVDGTASCGQLAVIGTLLELGNGTNLTILDGILVNQISSIRVNREASPLGAQLGFQTTAKMGNNTDAFPFGNVLLNAADEASLDTAVLASGPSLELEGRFYVGGTGQITGTLANRTTVEDPPSGGLFANTPGRTLQIAANLANEGLMRAFNGGILELNGANVTQSGDGVIRIEDGAFRMINSSLTGGLVVHAPPSPPPPLAGSEVPGLEFTAQPFANLIFVGDLELAGDSLVTDTEAFVSVNVQAGGLTNNGTMTLDSVTGFGTTLNIIQGNTLTGLGTVVLEADSDASDDLAATRARFEDGAIHDTNHTIRGSGLMTGTGTWINRGAVTADVPGRVLQLTRSFQNDGTIRAENGGRAYMSGLSVAQGPAGLIEATGAGSCIELDDYFMTITGGTVRGAEGGTVVALSGPTLIDSIVEGAFEVTAGVRTGLRGTVTVDGTVTVNPSGDPALTELWTNVAPIVPVSIDGTGTIVLNAEHDENLDSSRITAGDPLTLGPGLTVRGTGRIDGPQARTIDGEVVADQPGRVLELMATIFNNGTLRADPGAILRLNTIQVSRTIVNENGEIHADDGTVELTGSGSIRGGVLRSTGAAGLLKMISNIKLTDRATIDGTFHVSEGYQLQIDSFNESTSSVVNNGQIIVNPSSGAGDARVRFVGTAYAFDGDGEVLLNAVDDLTDARIQGGSQSIELVNGPAHSIRGNGWIEARLVNAGTLAPGLDLPASHATLLHAFLLEQASTGRMEIEIAGAAAGTEHDQIVANGGAMIAGELEVRLVDGFEPTVGQQFTVLTTGSQALNGMFGTVDCNFECDVTYTANSVVVTYLGPPCAADIGGGAGGQPDGQVDVVDLLQILAEWGCTDPPGPCTADIAGAGGTGADGVVGVLDLLVLLGAWGACGG